MHVLHRENRYAGAGTHTGKRELANYDTPVNLPGGSRTDDADYNYHDRIEPAGPAGLVYALPAPVPIAEREYENAEEANDPGHGVNRILRSPSGYELRPPSHMRAQQPGKGLARAVPISDEGYDMPDMADVGLGNSEKSNASYTQQSAEDYNEPTAMLPPTAADQDMFRVQAPAAGDADGGGQRGKKGKGGKRGKGQMKRHSKHMISLRPAETGGMMINPMAAHINTETTM